LSSINESDTWYNKGLALYKLEKYEKAIKCCDEAIRINPKDDEYKILSQYLNRG